MDVIIEVSFKYDSTDEYKYRESGLQNIIQSDMLEDKKEGKYLAYIISGYIQDINRDLDPIISTNKIHAKDEHSYHGDKVGKSKIDVKVNFTTVCEDFKLSDITQKLRDDLSKDERTRDTFDSIKDYEPTKLSDL